MKSFITLFAYISIMYSNVGVFGKENLTDNFFKAYNFMDKQKVQLLEIKLKHMDEAMKKKDDEINMLKRNVSELDLVARAYYTHWCGNQFRQAVGHIENNFVTDVGFISTYSSFNATILSCIDNFNLIRKQKRSTAIDKAKLEKLGGQVSVKKTTFTRQEKWYLLAKWFLKLREQPNELQTLKDKHPELFNFRETFLNEFQNGTLQTPDNLLAIVTSKLFEKTWDLVTVNVVKRVDKPTHITLEQLKAVINSLPDLKNGVSACVNMIVKEPKFILWC